MQTYDEGRKHKTQENGQRERNENFSAEIQCGNDQRGHSHIRQHCAAALRKSCLGGLLLQLRCSLCRTDDGFASIDTPTHAISKGLGMHTAKPTPYS